MNAVDTNIFVYALDSDDPVKQGKAQALLGSLIQQPHDTVLLWQVAGEFLACLRKWEVAGRITAQDTLSHFNDILAMFPLHASTNNIFHHSFDLRARYSLSHWDSMLLAACKDGGVRTVYSEDFDSQTKYDGISIINPFH